MKKQTAVKWLELRLNSVKPTDFCSIEKVKDWVEQAKAMEKEQIIAAYRDGRTDQNTRVPKFYNRSSAIYYTSTYGQ